MSKELSAPFFALMAALWLPAIALAQRDAPVWDSYLPRISLFKERKTLDFELTFKKNGGPIEQSPECQMVVFAYIEKDELKILEMAVDKNLTTKNQDDEPLLIEKLLKEKLLVQLETKVSKKAETPLTNSPKTNRTINGGNCYDFEFSFDNVDLFEKVGSLKNFKHSNAVSADSRLSKDKFKLMIFVPVNNSRYATLLPEKQNKFYDFAHFMDSETIIQYFKPLPYNFQFNQNGKDIWVYVD